MTEADQAGDVTAARYLAPLERRLPAVDAPLPADVLLERFLDYCAEIRLTLYPAQEQAILEISAGQHVILNTPTGSGKSLVALAACFKALADGGRAFYTAPIKALVTEKFFELCEVLGASNVGLMTGDASVNRDAPVICCTAEILANLALAEGERLRADWVVMDEFHYYSDRERGVSWQIPLITLSRARFVLMSATLGDTEFFLQELETRTRVPAVLVRSSERPVPLDFEYRLSPLHETIQELVRNGRVPAYIVHFSQRAATEAAQNLMSLNFLSKPEKQTLKEELVGFRFDSPFGKELQRFIPHGVGVHHAGMLPKYRRLVERLSRKGLLRVICGTDTLGVGVNVPIRTVLFTQLCKFDGQNTTLLSVRDFQQIAGRAGRRGFDTQGSVIVQAPEHEIENKQLKDRALGDPKKQKKLRLKKPPERGYKPWSEATLTLLRDSKPEPLVSRFALSHGMLLTLLTRPSGGCRAAKQLVRDCHESKAGKRRLLKSGVELFRSLVAANIAQLTPTGVLINAELQRDFSLNQELSLYALEVFESLDQTAQGFALTLLSVLESILEDPAVVLRKQVDLLKTRRMAELKAQGVEYEQRIEELEKIEYPKPEAEFIYTTFNLFRKEHPWVSGYSISPKSVVREMYEQAASFNDYIKDYGLAQAEGVLLRYLTDCYRTLRQTVPDKCKTDEVLDIIEWLSEELRSVDASLIEEWEQLQQAASGEVPKPRQAEPELPPDITRNRRAFRVMVRNAAWRFVQALARQDSVAALEVLSAFGPSDPLSGEPGPPRDARGELWTTERLATALAAFTAEYGVLLTDANARSATRSALDESNTERWLLRQTLSDHEENLDWAANFEVDLAKSRAANRPVLSLLELASLSAASSETHTAN